jgi:hypothetical protein
MPGGAFELEILPRIGQFSGNEEFPARAGNQPALMPLALPQLTRSGTAVSLAIGDAFADLNFTNGAAVTLTIPADVDLNWLAGVWVNLNQLGAGQVTVAGAVGVTVNSAGGLLALSAQYAVATLIKKSANSWLLMGSLA